MDWIVKKYKPRQNGIKEISVPADKSITHRAVMLSAFVEGSYTVKNYLPADDCMSTINAFRSMGVDIKEIIMDNKRSLSITGSGKLKPPQKAIDAGNSGTTTRLLCGILAGQDFETEITGDASLSKRPMKRVIEPLRLMGAKISAREDNYLPLKIAGTPDLKPITYRSSIASAQVKSCVLFAGMQAKGKTTFIEPVKSRDHTERMLKFVGVEVKETATSSSVIGPVRIPPGFTIDVPGDISAAAFFLAAGALLPKTKIKLSNVGINPTRDGIIDILRNMNAELKIINNNKGSWDSFDPVADIEVGTSQLTACDINGEMIPRLIDEIPVVALAATQAKGATIISGAEELRFKESDRLKAVAAELNKMGAAIEETKDGLIITGPVKLKGCEVDSHDDHRIAMMLAVAGLLAEGETTIKNTDCVSISFPDFKLKLNGIGAEIE
ncbi:MAG: 3-phosphoshikimate 1-carboxyvinyltransferase [Elusimicrobia bacterium]|nr:3-phosphoshikimate 1-carboxyvinyltransferase [Candidatus Liberimonas magnetica]